MEIWRSKKLIKLSEKKPPLVDKHAILCKLALIDSVNTKGLPKQCRLTLCKDPNDISLWSFMFCIRIWKKLRLWTLLTIHLNISNWSSFVKIWWELHYHFRAHFVDFILLLPTRNRSVKKPLAGNFNSRSDLFLNWYWFPAKLLGQHWRSVKVS